MSLSIITLRPATTEDGPRLYEWRNAEETRRLFFDSSPLVREAHKQWLGEILARDDRQLLVGETVQGPVGVLRFDVTGGVAEVSVYLVPGQSGKGLGTALLKEGVRWTSCLPQVSRLVARIHPNNIASQKTFEKSGFRETQRVYEAISP